MTRVLSSACALLVLLGFGHAWAGGKPPIAILGLEVYDNGSGIDPETTKAAKELTAALRDRAKAGTGPFTPVPGGDKELIDEKLLANCDSEAPTCMAAIGTELGAEMLMYGKIEKAGQTYKVSIKLLNVNRKQLTSSTVESLPLTESTGVRASTHAKAWYAKLAGSTTGGSVVLKANIDRGTVMLDDDLKGNLTSGALTIPGVPEGRHTLAIEAGGYQRYETSITVRNGEATPLTATMVEMSKRAPAPTGDPLSVEGTVTTKSKTNVWKPIFYSSVVLAAGAGGYSIYEWKKSQDEAEKGATAGNSACGSDLENTDEHLKSACSHRKKEIIGAVVSGVLGAVAIGSFVMAYVRHGDERTDNKSALGQRKRRQLLVTPVVTPDGGGATLRFDW